jgi:hypothetical protein
MKDKTETKIQQDCFIWFNNNYCLNHHNPKCVIYSIPNDSESKEETLRKMATGMRSGASDLVVMFPNKSIYIEMKTPTGTQSDNQKQFQKDIENLGFEYCLARSIEQFKEIIEKHIV